MAKALQLDCYFQEYDSEKASSEMQVNLYKFPLLFNMLQHSSQYLSAVFVLEALQCA